MIYLTLKKRNHPAEFKSRFPFCEKRRKIV
jgi:hypothetical protein